MGEPKGSGDLDRLPTSIPPQKLSPRNKFRISLDLPSFLGSSCIPFVLSTSISSLIVVLALNLNSLAQSSSNWTVNVDNCTCDCWDRAFKGNYGHGGYKHVYFQMNTGTSILWLWSAAHFVMLLKFVELATVCVLGSLFGARRMPRVRWLVLFLSCFNFYGMFYNWWITFNYINDAGLHQSYHILLPTQLFFDVTDVIPAIALYSLLQKHSDLPSTRLMLASLIVSTTHLILSMWDQGFIHLLTLQGAVLRDAMFIVSDLAGLVGVGWFMRGKWRKHGTVFGIGTVVLLLFYLLLKRIVGYR